MESEVILHNSSVYTQHVCSTQGCEWKIIVEMLESSFKNKSQSNFLEEIFRPVDSKTEKCSIWNAAQSWCLGFTIQTTPYCLHQNIF